MPNTSTAPRLSQATPRPNGSLSILRGRLKFRDAARQDFRIQLKEDETFADVQRPEYFGLSADKLRPGDRIEVVGFEFGWWAEMLVVAVDEALRAVRVVPLLGPIDLQERIASVPSFDTSKARVEQIGDAWRIVLGQAVIAAGFASKAEADAHVEEIKNGRRATSKA
jgi:hypothetical protein